jgi:DNA-binding HxlR family transcriptional regulator
MEKERFVEEIRPNVLDVNCGSRRVLELVAQKWVALVVYALIDGRRRHGELRRMVGGISQKMLTQTLRTMEADGLVARHVFETVPPHVEYELTALGRSLQEPLGELCRWSMEHLHELDDFRAQLAAGPAAGR